MKKSNTWQLFAYVFQLQFFHSKPLVHRFLMYSAEILLYQKSKGVLKVCITTLRRITATNTVYRFPVVSLHSIPCKNHALPVLISCFFFRMESHGPCMNLTHKEKKIQEAEIQKSGKRSGNAWNCMESHGVAWNRMELHGIT